MQLVIADTGPVNYLILIGHIDILAALFGTVVLPSAVRDEMSSQKAPPKVRQWSLALPVWVEVRDAPLSFMEDVALQGIDAGERAAIALASSLRADLLLIDDRKGVHAAVKKGIRVTGTLGLLEEAAQQGLLTLGDVFARLRQTTFHCPERLMQDMLDKNER